MEVVTDLLSVSVFLTLYDLSFTKVAKNEYVLYRISPKASALLAELHNDS